MNKTLIDIENAVFKPTWVMVKMHMITGLKYLCKTNCKDPLKYVGSGTYWRAHLKKYGADKVTTVWHHQFTDKDCMVKFAMGFSKIFDIVKSVEWANLIDETGLDNLTGAHHSAQTKEIIGQKQRAFQAKFGSPLAGRTTASPSSTTRERMSNSRRTWVEQNPDRMLEIANTLKSVYANNPELRMKHSKPGELNPMYGVERSDEWRAAHSKFMSENNPMKGKRGQLNPNFGKPNKHKGKTFDDIMGAMAASFAKQKMSDAAKNRKKVKCPQCGKIGSPSNMKRWHFDNCKAQK